MASNDFSRFLNTDFLSVNSFGSGFQSLMEAHRKNIEAFTEAQQLALNGMQALFQHQTGLLTRIVEDNSRLAREIMSESTPEQKIVRQADMMKKTYENSVGGLRELATLINKSSLQTTDILSKRVSASFTEMKSTLEKGAKNAAAASRKAA